MQACGSCLHQAVNQQTMIRQNTGSSYQPQDSPPPKPTFSGEDPPPKSLKTTLPPNSISCSEPSVTCMSLGGGGGDSSNHHTSQPWLSSCCLENVTTLDANGENPGTRKEPQGLLICIGWTPLLCVFSQVTGEWTAGVWEVSEALSRPLAATVTPKCFQHSASECFQWVPGRNGLPKGLMDG